MTNLEKSKFFNELALAMGTPDLVVAKGHYYSIMKFIVRETKKTGKFKLPDFGEFRTVLLKARVSNIPHSKEKKFVGAKWIMRFNPDYKIKAYLNG